MDLLWTSDDGLTHKNPLRKSVVMIEGREGWVIPAAAEKHMYDHDSVITRDQRQEKLQVVRHSQNKIV